MRKKTAREARDSALASGWRVEAGEEPSTDAPHQPVGAGAATREDPASPQGSDGVETAAVESTEGSPAISNGALVALGVFGGLYLLYTWGWFIVAQAYSEVNAYAAAGSGSLGGALQQIVFWAAPLAPALWFFVALVVSRGGRTKRLALVLFIGAIVLIPLPMLIARGG